MNHLRINLAIFENPLNFLVRCFLSSYVVNVDINVINYYIYFYELSDSVSCTYDTKSL